MPRGAFAGALGAGAGASAILASLAVGAALCYCGPRAVRCGGYRFWAFVVMCRAALRRVCRLRRNLLVSLLRSRPMGPARWPSSQLLCAGSARRGG